MGKPHPIELRERVQAEIADGGSRRGAAGRFKVSASFAVKLAARFVRTGLARAGEPGPARGGGKFAPHVMALIEWVEAAPDITMPELAAKLLAERSVAAHPAALSRVLIDAGFSLKKHFSLPRPSTPMSVKHVLTGRRSASHACARRSISSSSSMRPARRRR